VLIGLVVPAVVAGGEGILRSATGVPKPFFSMLWLAASLAADSWVAGCSSWGSG
jgi:hypothetical protein